MKTNVLNVILRYLHGLKTKSATVNEIVYATRLNANTVRKLLGRAVNEGLLTKYNAYRKDRVTGTPRAIYTVS